MHKAHAVHNNYLAVSGFLFESIFMENFKEFFRVLGNVFKVPLLVEAPGTWHA